MVPVTVNNVSTWVTRDDRGLSGLIPLIADNAFCGIREWGSDGIKHMTVQSVPLSGQCTQCPPATLQEARQVDAVPIVRFPYAMCWDWGSAALVGHAAKKLLSPLTHPPAQTDVAVDIGLAASIWALPASKL